MKEYQFYIVPTPIGNMSDMTKRAIEVLKEVDIIACEDSRVTQKLLYHYDIKTRLISYHKYNEKSRVDFFLNLLNEGNKIALVSDAGTPMICDPGSYLIEALRENNISYTALPGCCAVTTFLSGIAREDEVFTFIGFIPRTQNQIKNIINQHTNSNIVFYDSPNRILDTLEVIKEINPNSKVALGRELTKVFEETFIGNVDEVISHFKDGIKGEIVCMIYKDTSSKNIDLLPQINKLKDAGYKSKEISKILSLLNDIPKNEIYYYLQKLYP